MFRALFRTLSTNSERQPIPDAEEPEIERFDDETPILDENGTVSSNSVTAPYLRPVQPKCSGSPTDSNHSDVRYSTLQSPEQTELSDHEEETVKSHGIVVLDIKEAPPEIPEPSLVVQTDTGPPISDTCITLPEDAPKVNLCRVGQPNSSVPVSLEWTIQQFKEYIFPDEYRTKRNIRTIYQGKILDDGRTLKDHGLKGDDFLHIAITDPVSHAENGSVDPEHDGSDPPEFIAQQQLFMQQQPTMGTNSDFVVGFLAGAICGWPLFFICWPLMNAHKRKLGVICGVIANFVIGYYYQPPPGSRHSRSAPRVPVHHPATSSS